jgi:hypothetical protein
VVLVELHTVGDPATPRAWLEAHARPVERLRRGQAHVTIYDLSPLEAR